MLKLSFSININGSLHGFFQGKRGLRQSDPMSPYLFTMVMEVLTLMLKRNIADDGIFQYHARCHDLGIVNLCFADDLMMFCNGDKDSLLIIKNSLEEFTSVSGLQPSLPKSTIFFANVNDTIKAEIQSIIPFAEGIFPIRYLGVPLISSRLFTND